MKPLLERLKNGETLLADGAMGSMLFKKGLKPGACPEALNLSQPEILQEIAQSYFDAGADIIQTNSFGGSAMKLSEYGLDDKTEKINKTAVSIVKNVVGDNAYVSGSCGPSGQILQPFGTGNTHDFKKGFTKQIIGMVDAGVDLICVETMTDLHEATIAVKSAKEISPQTPVMATMTFEDTPRGFYTIMGVNINDAVDGLQKAGADIIGSNCGNGIEKMIKIAAEFRKITDLPILIQSNAGIPKNIGGKLEYPETPEFFAEKIPELIEIGVSIIGGCCGTTPETIKAMRAVLESRK